MAGSRVTRLAVLAGLVVLVLDLVIDHRLTLLFDAGFVLVCLAAALAVAPKDFFRVGVLPPLLLLGYVAGVAMIRPGWVADERDGFIQAVVSGLAHRAGGLLTAYLLVLAVLVIRQRVALKRGIVEDYENLTGSPAPTLETTAAPSERSTTVVGSEPHSPESMTASSQ